MNIELNLIIEEQKKKLKKEKVQEELMIDISEETIIVEIPKEKSVSPIVIQIF